MEGIINEEGGNTGVKLCMLLSSVSGVFRQIKKGAKIQLKQRRW